MSAHVPGRASKPEQATETGFVGWSTETAEEAASYSVQAVTAAQRQPDAVGPREPRLQRQREHH